MPTKSLNKSLAETILTAASGTATGLGYATPAAASLISYQITFGTEPSVENITIEGSADNSSWSVLATSTAIVNNTGYVITALPFIRAKINTNTGGLVVNVVVIAKPYTVLNETTIDAAPAGVSDDIQINLGGVFAAVAAPNAFNSDGTYFQVAFPDDYSDVYLLVDQATHRLNFGATDIIEFYTPLNITLNERVVIGGYEPGSITNPMKLVVGNVIDNGLGAIAAASSVYIDTQLCATDLDPTDGVTSLNIRFSYGYAGAASKGTGGPLNVVLDVSGSGHADNEPALKVERLNVNIGTDFTQTTGPVGRIWFSDQQVMGPVGVQPDALNGAVMLLNNSYNGSPVDSPAATSWFCTIPDKGAEPGRVGVNTYPVDVGIGIVGFSKASAVEGVGFTKALQIGGFGTPWGEDHSKIGTGIDISQYAVRGLYIHDATGTPTAAIDVSGLFVVSSAGIAQAAGFKSSDGSAGATTTITTASLVGKTATFKNGLLVSFV